MSEAKTGEFVVLGGDGIYGKWGKGPTKQQAKDKFRSYGGQLALGYTLLEFPPHLEFQSVDQMGTVHWKILGGEKYDRSNPSHQPIETVVKPRRKS